LKGSTGNAKLLTSGRGCIEVLQDISGSKKQ
jgi:hypothetical protein